MKKRKEEILRDKGQSSVQPTAQYTAQHAVQSTEQSTEKPSVQSNGAYVYGVGILAVLAIGVCVFFAYKTSQAANKNKLMKNRINHQNDVICFRSDDEKNLIQ